MWLYQYSQYRIINIMILWLSIYFPRNLVNSLLIFPILFNSISWYCITHWAAYAWHVLHVLYLYKRALINGHIRIYRCINDIQQLGWFLIILKWFAEVRGIRCFFNLWNKASCSNYLSLSQNMTIQQGNRTLFLLNWMEVFIYRHTSSVTDFFDKKYIFGLFGGFSKAILIIFSKNFWNFKKN